MEKLKVGVVGCGAIGREHIARITDKFSGADVVAVSDVFIEGARKVGDPIGAAIYNNSADLVYDDDVDAVICTSPDFAHMETIMQCIEAGKPVFTEKPLSTNPVESRAIVEAEMRNGKRLVQVGFMRRYDDALVKMKSMLKTGDFGEALYARCTHWGVHASRDYDDRMLILDGTIHELDTLHWLLEDDFTSAQIIMPKQTSNTHLQLHDPQIIMLRFKSGRVATIEMFMNSGLGFDINCQVVCENGIIELPGPGYPTYRQKGGHVDPIEQDWKRRFVHAYDHEILDWINSTMRGEVNGPNAWDGYITNVVMEALLDAQISGDVEPIIMDSRPDFYK